MNLDKAIAILTRRVKDYIPGYDPYESDATNLGIEALKREQAIRCRLQPGLETLLPGETKE